MRQDKNLTEQQGFDLSWIINKFQSIVSQNIVILFFLEI